MKRNPIQTTYDDVNVPHEYTKQKRKTKDINTYSRKERFVDYPLKLSKLLNSAKSQEEFRDFVKLNLKKMMKNEKGENEYNRLQQEHLKINEDFLKNIVNKKN